MITRHAEKMKRADAGLHEKTGTTHPGPTTTPKARAVEKGSSWDWSMGWKWGRYIFAIVALATIVKIFLGSDIASSPKDWMSLVPKPGVSEVKDWGRDNWLSVLVVASILFVLATLYGKSLAGMLRVAIVAAVLMLYFGIGFGESVRDLYRAYQGNPPQASCAPFSMNETRTCVLVRAQTLVAADANIGRQTFRVCISA